MFRKLIKNKKAQNTAEYAILISIVVAGIVAMQTYAQRTLQGRVRDAAQFLQNKTSDLGNTVQYEPYYLSSEYNVVRNELEIQRLDSNLTRTETNSVNTRQAGGFQESVFNAEDFGNDGF